MFNIAIDPARKLMTVEVSGFWDERTFKDYAAEAAIRSEELRYSGGFDFVLIDMSDFPIQAQAVAEMHGRLLKAAQNGYGVKAAVVMRSALSRLQAARVARLTGKDLFDEAGTALASLIGPKP
jgi:hypothetical protein